MFTAKVFIAPFNLSAIFECIAKVPEKRLRFKKNSRKLKGLLEKERNRKLLNCVRMYWFDLLKGRLNRLNRENDGRRTNKKKYNYYIGEQNKSFDCSIHDWKTVVKFYSSKVFFLTNPFIKNVLPGPPKFNFKTTKRPASW